MPVQPRRDSPKPDGTGLGAQQPSRPIGRHHEGQAGPCSAIWRSLTRSRDERFGQLQTDLALSCDAMLMGRRTYDVFAPVWPTRSGDPLSDQINALPKDVVSTTLRDPEWNNTHVIDGDVVGEITRIQQAPGKDIVQYGYGVRATDASDTVS